MMEIDLTPLMEMDTQYEQIILDVVNHFQCDWDDKVHDSYGRLVKQFREYEKQVKAVRLEADKAKHEVEALRINEIDSKTDALCEEARSV